MAAGMAGGSTDAAAVMLCIRDLYGLDCSLSRLQELAVTLGADIPYCLAGGTKLCEGIGEILTALPNAPQMQVLIAKPEAGASTGEVGSAIIVAGMVGYIARGIAFAVLGVLIVWAGWANDPEEAGGLDAALRTLGEQPAGSVLLILVGVGLALYGVYSLARARYVRM